MRKLLKETRNEILKKGYEPSKEGPEHDDLEDEVRCFRFGNGLAWCMTLTKFLARSLTPSLRHALAPSSLPRSASVFNLSFLFTSSLLLAS